MDDDVFTEHFDSSDAEVLVTNVFGVSTEPVLSYIEREEVDNKFLEAIQSGKQVIVYGSSKQGKTALVSRYLLSGAK